ncbi:MAG: hypothetical protein V4642_03090 [Bacteroidota bacterium]
MHAYFIYTNLSELLKVDDIDGYVVEQFSSGELFGNFWLVNLESLKDLYNLLHLDSSEIHEVVQKETFIAYGILNNFKKSFSKISDEEINKLSVEWTEKSFPSETNPFDICGYLLEARNYIQNSKKKESDLYIAIITETQSF